jgi:nucleoside-diphosphate-sugar epimerase
MATYLITGVAGFIAAKVAGMLLAGGHVVVGVDNMNNYYDLRVKYFRLGELARQAGCEQQFAEVISEEFLPKEVISLLDGKNFHFRKVDIEDRQALEVLFKEFKFTAVINLAARAGVRASMENPFAYMTTNAVGTLNLLECMRIHGMAKFVLASTSSLYAGEQMPFTEDMPVNHPLSPYAASKKSAEVMAYSYHKLYGLDVSILRYFTAFGPAGRPDMSVFRFIHWIKNDKPLKILGDGTQTRDFTYIDDIARGTIAALVPLGYEIINIGGGNKPVALNTVIEFIENLLGKKTTRTNQSSSSADMPATSADISKAGKLLGWMPQVSLEKGLYSTIEWHSTNNRWLTKINLS